VWRGGRRAGQLGFEAFERTAIAYLLPGLLSASWTVTSTRPEDSELQGVGPCAGLDTRGGPQLFAGTIGPLPGTQLARQARYPRRLPCSPFREPDTPRPKITAAARGEGAIRITPGLMETSKTRKDPIVAAPREYPDEQREHATRLAVEARKDPVGQVGAIKRIADQLDVHPEALRGWVPKAAEMREVPGPGRRQAGRRSRLPFPRPRAPAGMPLPPGGRP